MAGLPETYNKKFIDNPGENDAAGYGITIEPADVAPGADYWRIVGIIHLTGKENGGNHHAYADVLDEQGKRIYGARVGVTNAGTSVAFATIDKPTDEAGTNVPMHWNDTLALKVLDTLSSDEALGFHIRHDDEEDGNTRGHHSFYVVFQKTKEGSEPAPKPEPQPEPEPTPKPEPTPGPKPTKGLPGWRSRLSSFDRNLIKYFQDHPVTLEAELIVKLVDILNGEI